MKTRFYIQPVLAHPFNRLGEEVSKELIALQNKDFVIVDVDFINENHAVIKYKKMEKK